MNETSNTSPTTQSNAPAALHLIPVGLGDAPLTGWQPPGVAECVSKLTIYIAENAKTARAFLKQSGTSLPLQDITIHTLKSDTPTNEMKQWLEPLRQGIDIGLVSEAGCPAVADPGARVVSLAHQLNLRVVPWTGPSSILLALMASGLDGQRFSFHGYAPIKPDERAQSLKQWETDSRQRNQTQILIETPYRNQAMLDSLIQTLHPNTRLCIARDLTTPAEWIRTRTIAQWKQDKRPDLQKKPCIFLYLA